MGRFSLRGAKIVLENEEIVGNLYIEDGKIRRIERENDGTSYEYIVTPGVVDLHTHASGGYDYMDGTKEDIERALRSTLEHGVTSVLPTSLTSSDEDLFLFLDNIKKVDGAGLPHVEGVHLEGPYLSYRERGAQDPRFLRTPTKEHYMRILERGNGLIKRWSLAPELDGVMDMLDDLKDQGILFSAAHTDADYDTMREAADRGVRLLTHFYSGMSTIKRVDGFRVLGAVEAGYLMDSLYVECIMDGKHLPPELLRLIFKCKESSKIISCTDSMRGAGMGEGVYILGPKDNGLECIVENGVAKMMDHSGFAGSVATGETTVNTLTSVLGLTLSEAFRICSLQPAKLINIDSRCGSIEEGKDADLLLFDKSMSLRSVFVSGEEKYRRS